MTATTFPRTVTIYGDTSDGVYCAVTGEAVSEPYSGENFVLDKIDLQEYLQYWLHNDQESPVEINVNDIGGWDGLGARVEPDYDFRAEELARQHDALARMLDDPESASNNVARLEMHNAGGRFELHVVPGRLEMTQEWDAPCLIGRWDRLDHAYATARALCRMFDLVSFEVQLY